MTFLRPVLLPIAVLAVAALVAAYLWLHRRTARTLAASGLGSSVPRRAGLRRHLPNALFLTALALLLVAPARPQGVLPVVRTAATVILTFDVSNSMAADDVDPSRLAAAKSAAVNFVGSQPDSVDIGVVAFGEGALITQAPTENRAEVIAAINRLNPGGGTAVGQAILTALTSIVGRPVNLPTDETADGPADLGYWGSATIVLLSDGEDGSNLDAVAAAELAADAGVRIETIGVGTTRGATIEVDGFQVGTALDEDLLKALAETTSGTYHVAADAAALDRIYQSIDLRTTVEPQPVELTGLAVGLALLLLTAGSVLLVIWFGRIL